MAFGQGAAAGATIGTAIAPGPGTIIGGGIGLLGDIFGLAMDYSAAKKQEKRTDYVDKIVGTQYAKEYADKRSDTEYLKGQKEQDRARQTGLDRLTNQQSWLSNIAGIINKDQVLKNSFVNMWQSKTGRVA
jgi:hypothetical protein